MGNVYFDKVIVGAVQNASERIYGRQAAVLAGAPGKGGRVAVRADIFGAETFSPLPHGLRIAADPEAVAVLPACQGSQPGLSGEVNPGRGRFRKACFQGDDFIGGLLCRILLFFGTGKRKGGGADEQGRDIFVCFHYQLPFTFSKSLMEPEPFSL